ncbi:tail fibers protein [Aeromonas phage 85AhydR10PP]|nr:tail fibers protein [Aeromonas phage 85AhydR10PP]
MKIVIVGASAPSWGNEEKTAINLKVMFEHSGHEVIPFTATPDDTEEHGRELFTRAKFGEYGEIAPYSGPTQADLEAKANMVKARKELALIETLIAPLSRASRLRMATPEEEAELETLERRSIALLRALPGRV